MNTKTIGAFEAGKIIPLTRTLINLRNTFEAAGIEFGEADVTLKAKGKKGKR